MRRSKLTAIVAAVLVLGLVLTVVAVAFSSSGPSPDDAVTGPSGTDQPASPQDEFVTPRPGMADVGPRPFTSAATGRDDRVVVVTFYSGVEPCAVLDHVDVDEQASKVIITLYEGRDPAAGDDTACPEIAVEKKVRVELSEPLADRKIVDGAAKDEGSQPGAFAPAPAGP